MPYNNTGDRSHSIESNFGDKLASSGNQNYQRNEPSAIDEDRIDEMTRFVRSVFEEATIQELKDASNNKNVNVNIDDAYKFYQELKRVSTQVQELNAYINRQGKIRDNLNIQKELTEKKLLRREKLRELEKIAESAYVMALRIPNIPDKSVPVGKDASGNVEVKKWGKVLEFDFDPKDHIELAKSLDLIDFERGAKVGGSRAYFLKNEAAQLEFAVLFYTFNKLIQKGYTPIIAPSLVREFTLFGNGQFPWGKEEVYHLEKDDLYLAGTAEVPLTAYLSDEVLDEKDLPKKFVAFSPCFRREAGSYGKDTRGVYRLHQFNKIEQVIISKNDMSNSFTLHEELLANAEEILQDLELPYRVLLMCTGDMGEPQVKKYDIETWMPGRPSAGSGLGSYGETMSNSAMGDFQARRLKIRYKAKDGRTVYCHTLNNTAIASPRILVAILENNQQADGSVKIPKVLQPFVGKKEIRR